MTLVRLFPTHQIFEGLSTDEQSWVIAKEYGICNGWRVNFAIDTSGSSFGETGKSADVSTELDRLLLAKLRSLADVIVTSGSTARAEKYRSSKYAPIAIFTTSGDLDSVPAIQGMQYFTPLLLTPSSQATKVAQALSDVDVSVLPFEASGTDEHWPSAVAAVLRREGYQSPILESGLSTLHEFLRDMVVDEICLSITQPKSGGVSARDLNFTKLSGVLGPLENFKLSDLYSDGKTTFSRWRRGSSTR